MCIPSRQPVRNTSIIKNMQSNVCLLILRPNRPTISESSWSKSCYLSLQIKCFIAKVIIRTNFSILTSFTTPTAYSFQWKSWAGIKIMLRIDKLIWKRVCDLFISWGWYTVILRKRILLIVGMLGVGFSLILGFLWWSHRSNTKKHKLYL